LFTLCSMTVAILCTGYQSAFRCYHNSESLWDGVRLCTSTGTSL